VDLAVAFNNEKRVALKEKVDKLKKEEQEMLKQREEYDGNRYDADVKDRNFQDD
jgi:hypothetical protein